MNQLETLLNSLIARGWKPWGKDAIKMSKQCPDRETGVIYIHFTGEERGYRHIRQLVSLESGLWQFVCKNKLYKDNNDIYPHIDRIIEDNYYQDVVLEKEEYTISDHKYRLLESALIPEEELGKFLVENIAIGGKKE